MARNVPLEAHSALALLEGYIEEAVTALVESEMLKEAAVSRQWNLDGKNTQFPTRSPALQRCLGLMTDWPEIVEALREVVSGSPRQGHLNPPEFRSTT